MRNPSGAHRNAPVTVSFPVPKKAASKLRSLAISKDRRLLDLGVLAVQINEGESIVLGIKLGRRRLKKTEVDSDKLKGNSSAGRVAKKHSTCRNAGTIHHMPAASPRAHSLPATKIAASSSGNDEENSRKRVARPDGDVVSNELFNGLSPGRTADTPSSDCKFRISDYTSSFDASVLSLNGQSNSSSAKETRPNKLQNSRSYATERSLISTESSMNKLTQGASVTKTQTPSIASPRLMKPARLVTGNESNLPAARRLSSPASQRVYSASPGSDTSSTSSEENLDAQQLIYSCFMDKSKYSAADMLKQLAEAHASKKDTTDTVATSTSALSRTVKLSATTTKSSSCTSFLSSEQPRIADNSKKPAVAGSYREHVKNIRCNSLTSLTTSTTTVNSTLKTPSNANEHQALGFQSCSGNIDKSSGFGERKLVTKHTTTHFSESKARTAAEIKSMKTGSTQTPAYRGGRKVLWSSANAFPSSTNLPSHLPVNKPTAALPQVNSPSSRSPTLHSQVRETTTPPSCAKSGTAMCNETAMSIPNDTHFSIHTSNKVSGQQLVNECRMSQTDSKTVIVKTPSLSFDSQESVTLSDTSSNQVAASTSSACDPGFTNIAQTESQGTNQLVQNLTLARSTLPPATVVLAGTNTQTTWSNQQVSPTYFVGAQAQYGIYPALYGTDVNNNQLGQQAVTATYPLNYVYPVSFVYPYLSMAQANSAKNVNIDKVKQQKEDMEVVKTDASVVDTASKVHVAKSEPEVAAQAASGNTVNLQSTQSSTSSTAPVQTQFIDLASSMRYWQELNLLYRSRWQALASCNLSNVATVTSNQANAAAPVTSVADDSSSTVVNGETIVVRSNSEQQSFSRLDILQANPAKDVYSGNHKPASELCTKKPCSEILQRVKPEIDSQEQNSTDMTSDRPSVIVAAACKDGAIEMPKSSSLEVKMQCKREEFDGRELQNVNERRTVLNSVSYGTSSTSEEEISPPRLHHHDKLGNMAEDNMGRRSFCSSTPKLSFIPDSSVACVNVGNSNGNGFGYTNSMQNHPGARRTCKFYTVIIA